MCDFKPGDEVVCVDDGPCSVTGIPSNLEKGRVYRVEGVHWDGGLYPNGLRNPLGAGWLAPRFRKVQRRDLTAWLKTATKFEEPKRGKVSA